MANRFLSNIRINDAYTFPASDGNDGQVITTDGAGNLAFENVSPDAASVIYRDNFTGDGSTVAFDLQNSITDEDQTQIYIDGVYQEKSTYSISGTTITFTTAPILGHSVEVISISSINTGPTVLYQDNFTGNGSDTAFTLGQAIDNEIKTFIFLNGVYQFKNTYTVDGTTLTFDAAPANGVAIEVVSIASAVQSDSLEAGSVIIPVKNTHNASISKGTPVYISGNVGNSARLQIAPADASNSAKMPAAGLLLTTLAVNAEGYAITGGYLRNITTDTIHGTSTASNDTVYVKAGGGLTMTKPTGSNLIQNIAKIARSASGSSGSLLVSSILRTNDVPNITNDYFWLGNSSGVATATSYTSRFDTAFATKDTDDLSEGATNLYYTDARSRSAISVSGNALSYNSSTGVITSNYEESPTFTGIITASSSSSGDYVRLYGSSGTAQWDIYGNGENLRISENSGGGGHVDIDTNLVVDGNVTLNGATALDFQVADFAQIKFRESGAITIDSDNNQSSRNFQFKDGDGTTLMFIGDNGNVGIGTTSPGTIHGQSYGTTKLHIDGGTDRGQLVIEGDSLAAIAFSDNGATANERVFYQSVNGGLFNIKPLNDNGTSAASTGISMLHNGNVGIGTSDPDARFSAVSSSANSTIAKIGGLEYSGNQRGLTIKTFQSAGGDDCGVEFNAAEGLSGYGSFIFKADTAERMRITSSGNVGIGTTSPDLTGFGYTTLTVVGGTTAGYAGVLELGSPTTNANGQNLGIIAFMDGSTRNAQINVTRASSTSTSNMHFYTNGGSGIVEKMRIESDGGIFFPSLGGFSVSNSDVRYNATSDELYYQTSSKRYKSEITDLENSLDKINNLRPVRFKDNLSQEYATGMIAEEVAETIPEVVFTKPIDGFDEPQIEGINYSDLVPFLIKSIQELKADNDSLKARIETLENN
jgi:hypothetical protein